MASLQELKSVVKETLENRGALGQIKARIRAEVFNALDDQSEEKAPLSNENLLINELIREYLEFNKYKYTSSVLQSETGQPAQPLDRKFLAEELHISEDKHTATVPLLYGITAHFLSQSKSQAFTAENGRSRRSQRSRSQSPRHAHNAHSPSADGSHQGAFVIRGERR